MIIPEVEEVMLLCYQLLISSDDCIVIDWFSASHHRVRSEPDFIQRDRM
jgi:hypothetical protein